MTREEAINVIWNRCQHCQETEEAIKVIKEERPHGEWIIRRDKRGIHIYSVCSICNVPYLDTDFPNFCNQCGASMVKEGEEK